MKPEEKNTLFIALDLAARALHVLPLEAEVKEIYWRGLAKTDSRAVNLAIDNLVKTYRPKRAGDFPVLSLLVEMCGTTVEERPPWNCICCGVGFPAGGRGVCGCSKVICHRCWKCDEGHCHCPEGLLPLSEFPIYRELEAFLRGRL